MTITSTGLTRIAAICAIAAGVLFMGVQIGHPQVDTTSIQSTNVYLRDQVKMLMSVLALVGIAGMYLSQVRRNGLLGLIGYVVLSLGFLAILCDVYVSSYVLPELARSNPAYVNDAIVIGTSRGTLRGADVGALQTLASLRGFAYLGGGLIFGIALFRAHVLARWACVLLAVGGIASIVLSLMPDAFYRLLAFPNAIAMIGLGYSLWRTTRQVPAAQDTKATIPAPRTASSSEDAATSPAPASS